MKAASLLRSQPISAPTKTFEQRLKPQLKRVPQKKYAGHDLTDFERRITSCGDGVFTLVPLKARELVWQFRGRLYAKEEVFKKRIPGLNYFLQVDEDYYIGPAESTDNFINHSCEPNCGLLVENRKAYIIALRDIEIGDELTYDYSTEMVEDNWEMVCGCGSLKCRGKVKDFKYLPKVLQDYYISLGVVPDHSLRSIRRN